MLCRDGTISLFCFITAGLISLLPELLFRLGFNIYIEYFTNFWILHAVQYIFINILAFLAFRGFAYQVSVILLSCYAFCLIFCTYVTIISFAGGNQSIVSWIHIWNWFISIN